MAKAIVANNQTPLLLGSATEVAIELHEQQLLYIISSQKREAISLIYECKVTAF